MDSTFFLVQILFTGFLTLGAILFAYRRSRDSFHPLIYMGLLLFALYCALPFQLLSKDAERLFSYIPLPQLEFVQTLNIIGIVSLFAGILIGDRGFRFHPLQQPIQPLSSTSLKRIRYAAIFFGSIGVLSFIYGVANVGGLAGAYGQAYGGGSAASGWVRDAVFLTLPALLWLMVTHVNKTISKLDWLLIITFAAPHVIHGILGARRGPTAMIIVSVLLGWYLVRFRRPPLTRVIAGVFALLLLMLFLVTNRGNIYIGSQLNLNYQPTEIVEEVSGGNEYVYGGGAIINTRIVDRYFWGRRYFTIFFIRPIPRQIWPTKYEDSSRLLGIPNIEQNLGVGTSEFSQNLGWAGAVGAAPGIIADMWIEFYWFFPIALFLIGWGYGTAWQRAATRGYFWIPIYTLLVALSVYLITQTLEAMAFRFLIASAGSWLIWRYGAVNAASISRSHHLSISDRSGF